MNLLPLTQQKINVHQRDRVRALERDAGRNARPVSEEIVPWSHSGTITVTTAGESAPWRVRTGGQIVSLSAHLDTAGSSSTVFTVYLNGVSLGSVTLAASDTDELAYLGDYRAKNGDRITGRITTAGTGAKGFSAFLVMKG